MTVIGQPLRKHDLGQSQLDADLFMEYLTTIGNDRFRFVSIEYLLWLTIIILLVV